MTDDLIPSQPEPPAPAPGTQAPLEESVSKVFVGPNGIRAFWRLLIFIGIFLALVAGAGLVAMALNHGKPPQPSFTPLSTTVGEGLGFVFVLLAGWIMSRIEGRSAGDYGLPAREAFLGKFWIGAVIGFASLSVLLFAMRLGHVFYFGTIDLHGLAIVKFAILWGIAFLCVGFLEESLFRGYALFTLTTGITFWPSAIIASLVFGYVHHGNPGESWLGAFNAGAVGFLFCLMLRRTGNLWLPVGFHAAWDWGESYFYGVADSGIVSPGHLFNSKLELHPVWLSGGTVGPEGSWFCLALIVILWIIFAMALPEAKYPNPAALLNRRSAEEPLPSILPPQT